MPEDDEEQPIRNKGIEWIVAFIWAFTSPALSQVVVVEQVSGPANNAQSGR